MSYGCSQKVTKIKDDCKHLENEYRNKKSILIKFTLFEKLCLFSMLKERCERVSKSVLVSHRKKPLRLKKQSKSSICIYISKRRLTIREEDSLRFDLDNDILPKNLKIDDIKAQIEELVYFVLNKTKTQLASVPVDNQFKDEIKFGFKKFMNDGKGMCNNHGELYYRPFHCARLS